MRPASMAWALSQPPSSACKPKSPNVTVLPRVALPFTLPRWLFRNFTRLGISGIAALLGVLILSVINPDLDANIALGSVGLGEAEINLGPQGGQRNAAHHVRFLAGHFRPAQPAGQLHLDTPGAIFHGGVHGPLHRAAEAGPLLQLFGNILRDELRVGLGPVH